MAGESIRRVAAIGTGTIGASWTAVFLARGLTVAASDPAPGAETFLREFVATAWPSLARLSPLPAEPPWAALSFHTQPEAAVVGAEFIQESAPEREELKRALLARLDAVLDPEIVIASSSSGLLMSRMQIDCRHPERCVVGHPFNPPHLVPLVEVVGGEKKTRLIDAGPLQAARVVA
jgi:carnitine 3-dehydrogenase